jgi:fructokinase
MYSFSFDQNEEKLREVLQFSNACGAICTTQKGAIPALPTTAAALELINQGSN